MDCLADRLNATCGADVSQSSGLDSLQILQWSFTRIRTFFYLSNPHEESFEFVDQVPDYNKEMFPFVLVAILLEWLVLWLQRKPLPQLGESAVSVTLIVNMEIFRVLSRGTQHLAYYYIYNNYRFFDIPWDSVYVWYAAAILTDLAYYWGHRATHVFNALWVHHQVHHTGEHYSLINAFRFPFTYDFVFAFCYLPMAFIVPPTHFLVHHQLTSLFQFGVHTTLIGKLGPLEWIFNTPSHHRVHHGSNAYCLDKNFAGTLIIWDRMFGTFAEERDDVDIVYGLVDQVKSFNPFYIQFFYYEKMYQKWKSMDGWKNKMYSLIKGPGWSPGSPWTGFIEQVPDVTGRKPHTHDKHSLLWTAYFISHFMIVVFVYEIASIFHDRLSLVALLCHFTYVLLSMCNVGMFFDNHPAASLVEFVRCAFFLAYSHSGIPLLTNSLVWSGLNEMYGPVLESSIFMVLRSYFFVSTLVWGIIYFRQYDKSSNKVKIN